MSFAQEIFTVGISAPLSGDLAEYGTSVKNGITLAQEENAESFRKIVFAFEDNQYSAVKALSAYQRLKSFFHAQLIYNWGEQPLHAIAPLAEKAKLPIIAMSIDPEPSLGKEYVVRSINYAEQYTQALLKYFRKKNFKRIGIVYVEDPFFISLIKGLRKNLNQDESVEILFSGPPEMQDFNMAVTKVKQALPDVLGVLVASGQASTFFRQAGAQGLSVPCFGTDIFESQTEIANANGFMTGVVYPNIEVPEEFHLRYQRQFQNDNQVAYAYNAYLFARFVGKRFANVTEKMSGESIIKIFKNAQEPEYVFRSSKEGGSYYEFPLVIKEIQGKEIRVIR